MYVNIQCTLPTQGNVDTSLFDYHACYVTWDRKDLLIICIFVFIRHVSIHRYEETFIETSYSYLQDEIEYKWKYVIRLIGSLFFFTYMIRYPCNIRKQRFTELKEVTFQLGNGEQFELMKFVLLDMWTVENNNFAYEVNKYFGRLNILMYLLIHFLSILFTL